MDGDVQRLAQKFTHSPGMVDLSGGEIGPSLVEQFFCTVDENRKISLLVRLLYEERPQQAIAFCCTKRGADKLHARLGKRLKRNVEAIHGDLPQRKRDRVFRHLRDGWLRLLIATDVVTRGIDVRVHDVLLVSLVRVEQSPSMCGRRQRLGHLSVRHQRPQTASLGASPGADASGSFS